MFPDGFDLIRYDETVLPTWYIHPDPRSVGASLSYWKRANDTVDAGDRDTARSAPCSSSDADPAGG